MSKIEKKPQSVVELRAELAEAQRSHKMGELKNTSRLRELRREIARRLTAERQDDKKVEEK